MAVTAAALPRTQVPIANPMEHYDGSMESLQRNRAIVEDAIRAKGGTPTTYDHDVVAANEKKFKDHVQGGFKLTPEEMIMTVIAAIQYQDPMEPEKPGEVAKMFSTISMTTAVDEVRKDMAGMKKLIAQSMSLKSNNMVGQKIEVRHDTFKYDGTGSATLGFDLPVKPNQIEISIYDEKHQYIRQMILKEGDTIKVDGKEQKLKLTLGRNDFQWDGLKNDETPAKEGKYRFQVRPLDQQGNLIKDSDTGKPFKIKTYVTGTMESSFMNDNGDQRLLVDGIEMPLSAFQKSLGLVKSPSTEDTANPSASDDSTGPGNVSEQERVRWQGEINNLQRAFEEEKARVLTEDDLPPGLADI